MKKDIGYFVGYGYIAKINGRCMIFATEEEYEEYIEEENEKDE